MDMPAPTKERLEETDLEQLWKEEPGCQSKHNNPFNLKCSVEVTHLLTWCGGQMLICDNATSANRVFMEYEGGCAGCGQRARECWKLYPA